MATAFAPFPLLPNELRLHVIAYALDNIICTPPKATITILNKCAIKVTRDILPLLQVDRFFASEVRRLCQNKISFDVGLKNGVQHRVLFSPESEILEIDFRHTQHPPHSSFLTNLSSKLCQATK